jgi:endonuclease/exonuclease/phosphatase family metal-dependent hydrolase
VTASRVRLATLNLLFGLSLDDLRVDRQRLADAVASLDADVLALQEVDRAQPRSGGLDLTAVAAAALGAGHARFEPALFGTPGGSWRPAGPAAASVEPDPVPGEPDGPAYGVALVSRLPVESWHVTRLPAAPVRSPVPIPGTRRVLWLKDEPRVGLAAVLRTPAGPLTVATTHLSFVPGWGLVQLRRLVRELRALPAPRVLLGDLNLPGPVPALATRWTPLVRGRTFPAPRPRLQLDHVLASGDLPGRVTGQVRRLPVSDHLALVVDLGG